MRLSFLETLRQQPNTVPNPTGYGFDQNIWEQAYLAQRDGSPADHHAYLLGLMLAHQTGRVQGSIDQLASGFRFRSLDELSRFFSTRINEVQVSVFQSLGRALADEAVISRERIREMRCFTDAAGNTHPLQAPMEAVVDAMGGALKLLGRTGGLGTLEDDQVEKEKVDDALNRLMALAQHSLSIQRVWNSVVWWKAVVGVAPDCQNYVVDECGSDLVLRATVDLARRPALMERAIENFHGANPQTSSINVLVPYVQLRSGRLTVDAVPAFLVPANERKGLLEARRAHGILQDGTLASFVREIHPHVGLHVSEIMVIWAELAVMAGQLHALAQAPDIVKDKSKLSTIVESRLSREDIIRTIRQCVVLSADKAKECIDFLCFTPTKGITLWDRPLLSAGEDVMLLWWPLQGAHHARLLSAWAKSHKKLAIAFDSKGPANEAILAEAIREAIAKSPHRDHMRFIGAALNPRHKPDEDIDLLMVIDDTAFVIETASIPAPAEAYEFYETEGRLEKKAGQCRKQCAALKHDMNQIAEWAGDAGLRGRVTKVFGLVVTNSYLRDGFHGGDVCYCHWDTLINVLSGGMYFGLTRGAEEFTLKAPIQTGPGGSVVEGVIAALQKSPKTEFYVRCIVPVDHKVQGFDETDIEGYYRALEVDIPPQEMLEKRVRECSFAATLEEVEYPQFS